MTIKEEILWIEYKWTHDQDDQGEHPGVFIGTWQQFKDVTEFWQEAWGFNYWNLTTRPATDEEIEKYL